jgi:DNA-binding transcriptional MerR regulator
VTALRIAEVAERTGVPATTLRYYEDIGLLAPADRAANGYRAYTERDVERLLFLTRVKPLELTLDDLRGLLAAWDGADCGDVRSRLADLVARHLDGTRGRVAELDALASRLRAVADRLAAATAPHPGGCADDCACVAEPDPPIGCTLTPGALAERVERWRAVLATATSRAAVPGGARLGFALGSVGEVARLAAAEHECCGFLDFALGLTGGAAYLDVRAPAAAQELLTALFLR